MSVRREIKSLEKKTEALKGSLDRFKAYLDTFDVSNDFFELEARLLNVEKLLLQFDEAQLRLEELHNNDEDFELERDSFESKYYSLVARAKSLLSNKFQPTLQQSSDVVYSQSNIKLPALNLPTFDGSLNKWTQFHDTFQSLIHKNTHLTSIQKFYYLLSSLTGEALQAVQSLQVTDANYLIAWELLCDRYKNNRTHPHSHSTFKERI